MSKLKQKAKYDARAIRAYRLSLRGHSLEAIAEMVPIPIGSVTKRIALGERLLSLKGSQ